MIDLKTIETYPNGMFYVQVRPDDSVTQFNVNCENCIEKIMNKIPTKYQDKVLGLKKDKYGDYTPVFDEQTQMEWNTEYKNYISRKAAWCQKHGSE